MRRTILALMLALMPAMAAVPSATPAHAQQKVQIGDKEAILHVPPNARASAVLVPGKARATTGSTFDQAQRSRPDRSRARPVPGIRPGSKAMKRGPSAVARRARA